MRTLNSGYVVKLGLGLMLISVMVYLAWRTLANPPDSKLVKADNEFGFRILKELLKKDPGKNILISPAGLALDLQLAYNGASGRTRHDMAKALRLEGMSLGEINRANGRLTRMLENPNPGVKMDIANSILTGKGVRFRPEFLKTNERYYKVKVSNLGTSKPDGTLALVSASRFDAQWMYKLDKSEYDHLPFRHRDQDWNDVEAVSSFGVFRFRSSVSGGPKIIRLPYVNRHTSMYLLDSYAEVLDARSWEKWMSEMRQTVVTVCIPVWTTEYAADLGSSLKALGIDLSSDAAKTDFGKMCLQPFNVTGIQHSARVEVREGGDRPAPQQRSAYPQAFLANHPFFFAIRDDRTGLILFMGWVADPTEGLKPSD